MTLAKRIRIYLETVPNEMNVVDAYENLPFKEEVRFNHFKAVWKEGKDVLQGVKNNVEKFIPKIELNLWTPKSENFSEELFRSFKTNTGLDTILSVNGGVTKGTQYIVTGEPGVGKTTVLAYLQKVLQDNYSDAKIACVQTEMKRFDIGFEYIENKLDWMGDIQYIILKDYGYENCKEVLQTIFTSGFDILFVDSLADICEKLRDFADMNSNEALNYVLSLMDNAADAKNNNGVHTSTFAIQQVNKSGDFKGDNKLKHMTTGMLHLRFDAQGRRYISTSKNRRCGSHINKKLYYSLNSEKHVVFDIVSFNEAEAAAEYAREQTEKLKEHSNSFFEFVKSAAENDAENKTVNEAWGSVNNSSITDAEIIEENFEESGIETELEENVLFVSEV